MLRKFFAATAITGAALFFGVATAGAASASPTGDGHGGPGDDGGVSILNNLCVAPWQWNGPIEALTVGHAPVLCSSTNGGR